MADDAQYSLRFVFLLLFSYLFFNAEVSAFTGGKVVMVKVVNTGHIEEGKTDTENISWGQMMTINASKPKKTKLSCYFRCFLTDLQPCYYYCPKTNVMEHNT